MATCQKRLRPQAYSGDAGSVCGRPATHLCSIPHAYNHVTGRFETGLEYRCSDHLEGVAVEVRGDGSSST